MLPTLAVVFDFGSATAMEIGGAAEELCDLVFVCDTSSPYVVSSLPLLEGLGTVVPLGDTDSTVTELERLGVSGIVTFGDAELVPAALLAERLGLPFHSVATARVLADKHLQRSRLADVAAVGVRFSPVDPASPAGAFDAVGAPAVLKPRRGAGSRNTVHIGDLDELLAHVQQSVAGGDTDLILEELLVGDPCVAGPEWGDYISVESLAYGEEIVHVGVTGKPPLAEPFRETGAFYPGTVPPDVQVQACDLTAAALRALQVGDGVCHTELKLTAEGPRLIEVNGRLGGYVNDVYSRSTGRSLVQLAMAAALGRADVAATPAPQCVAYQLCIAPPTWARSLIRLDGVDAVRALPGVRRVDVTHAAGDTVDWRKGTASSVAVVHGEVADHAALAQLTRDVEATILPEYAG
jgi:biotin carboxylase